MKNKKDKVRHDEENTRQDNAIKQMTIPKRNKTITHQTR